MKTPTIGDQVYYKGLFDDPSKRGFVHKVVGNIVFVGWLLMGFKKINGKKLSWVEEHRSWKTSEIGETKNIGLASLLIG